MKLKALFLIIFIFALNSSGFPQKTAKKELKLDYLLYLPDQYKESGDSLFPLLIYLHGKSHRGSNLNKLKGYGLPFLIEKGHKYNFIIASPQCPSTTSWTEINWFDPLLRNLSAEYRIDPERVYVIGISLGGYGTWQAAVDHPDEIAAIIPLCGGCVDSDNICKIKNIPVWAFHGTADKLVNIRETESLVERLQNCDGNVKFTRLENAGHDITNIFEKQEIYDWLLQQKKK